MGKNRTKNFQAKEKSAWICAPARNLSKKELGAVIFGCKHHTFAECLQNKIFGLPASHYSYVKSIHPGLVLFLFNYSDRMLHGIYEAASDGQKNINAYAWCTTEGSTRTPYEAQVRVNVRRQCRPLHEEEFKPVIAENYYADRFFYFELDKAQTVQLSNLFRSLPLPFNPRTAVSEARNAPRPALDECPEQSHALVVVNNSSDAYAPQKKWAELFKASSSASSHEVSQKLPEAPTEARDSSIRESWEELADIDCDGRDLNEEEAEYEQDHDRDVDLQDGAFESGVAWESAEAVLSGESESSHEHNLLRSLQFGVLAANNSSRFEPVLVKLIQEIEVMKLNQFEQNVKIKSLENDLAGSKLEIDQLKKQYEQLESTVSNGG